MIGTVEEYLRRLRVELAGSDAAITQDALADAHEHLATALAVARERGFPGTDAEALAAIVDEFGTPEDTAQAYREVERRMPVRVTRVPTRRSSAGTFLGVYADASAWTAVLYMLLAFETGSFYLIWALAGTVFSAFFGLFVFGLPFAVAFLLSIRVVALIEGRLVEALLGVRMPRRPPLEGELGNWRAQLERLLVDRTTWRILAYIGLQFVLGCVYVLSILAAVGFAFVFLSVPFTQELMGEGVLMFGGDAVFLPRWTYPLCVVGGVLLLTVFMHFARWLGQRHARIAKRLLVQE